MGLADIANTIFGPILTPLLNLPPVISICIVAIVISVISVLVQKRFTDQDRLKFLKKETKKIQEEVRKNKDNPEKQLKLNKKMMPLQGEMMKASLRPTLWMMLPFLLVFMWLSAHFAFDPLLPGETFSITVASSASSVLLEAPAGVTVLSEVESSVTDGVARWEAQAEAGKYTLTFSTDTDIVSKDVLITSERDYEQPMQTYKGSISSVELSNQKLKPIDPFTIFGWRPGWIATYIIFSLVFSISLRKLLDVA